MFFCVTVTSITIPNSVVSIGGQSFSGCENLTSVYITDLESWCKTYFGDNPLKYAQKLLLNGNEVTEMVIPESVTSISAGAFSGYKGLVSVVLPDNLATIGASAFYGCSGLTSIIIPNSVTKIEWFAFSGCINLTTIIIGSGLKFIYERAFANCPELTDVYCFAVDVPRMLQAVTNKPCTNAFDDSYIEYATLHVPVASINSYRVVEPWNKFQSIVKIDMPKHTIVYYVDGEEYKKYEIEEGTTITPEPAPTKDGYTFSGWSEIPETMPAHDVTVTGTFSINKYKLTYTVDGEEYKTYEVEYGATITPEPTPTKEGYTFSGWSEIPETMPAHDLTVTGTFTINKYKLTYTVDGEDFKTYEVEYGATITPEAEPTKEGYAFSGWSEIPETMPAHDVTVTGSFSINTYKLTYIVDGEEYKSLELEYGATITPEAAPTKEGYTFSGWSEIPETMPAHDLTVTGTFSINKYKLTYTVDGEEYKSYEIEYGATITPEIEPIKEGYTFSGWNEIPETMPAHDVTVTGTFTINKYKLTYILDGAEYKTYEIEYNATITAEAEPTKEGYTFSGWSEIPSTMPPYDVTVTGTFSINRYKLTYMIDDEVYKETIYEYGATIIPEPQPEGDYDTFEWIDLPQTMPAHDVVVHASYTSGIIEVLMASQHNVRIYSPNGKKLNKLQKGLNIVIFDDGTIKKIVVR